MKRNYPKVDSWRSIGERKRHGKCFRGNEYWMEFTLQEAVKELEPFDLPLAAIDLSYSPWDLGNMEEIIYHINRVSEVNFDHPIILDDFGQIRDGYHRIAKAIIEGKDTIKAVRLKEMPPIDGKEEEE